MIISNRSRLAWSDHFEIYLKNWARHERSTKQDTSSRLLARLYSSPPAPEDRCAGAYYKVGSAKMCNGHKGVRKVARVEIAPIGMTMTSRTAVHVFFFLHCWMTGLTGTNTTTRTSQFPSSGFIISQTRSAQDVPRHN